MENQHLRAKQRGFILFCLFLFALSLPFNAFRVMHFEREETRGYEAFLMGSISFLGGGIMEWIVWLANPLFFFSIYCFRKKKNGVAPTAWISVLLAISFLFRNKILAAENGRVAIIESKGAGYFLWLISLICWAIGYSFVKGMPNRSEAKSIVH